MAVRIGSNIASIQAQRRLSEASSVLVKTYERLSSGQRINRAADDAAGLAIAETLKVGSRVFSQGVRNLNDTISYCAIAEGASRELKNILLRGKELAEQSANGVYSDKQRAALDNELQSLGQEYNRILESTDFNGRKIFARENGQMVSQAGDSVLSTVLQSERALRIDTISRTSAAPDEAAADGGSSIDTKGTLSADGRYQIFASSATNLIAGVGDGSTQLLYRKDNQTGELMLVSATAEGEAANGSTNGEVISPDGRYVFFSSMATNLAVGTTDGSYSQTYRKDLLTGELELASVTNSGTAGDGYSTVTSASSDGRYVAFQFWGTNLADDGQLLRKDMLTGDIDCISETAAGIAGDTDSYQALLSADGRFATFASASTNLVPGVDDGKSQVYLKDLATGELKVVSTSSQGTVASMNTNVEAFSADGRYVLFSSTAANLIDGVGGGANQLYRKDVLTGDLRLVSADSTGVAGDFDSDRASMSADGRYVAFISGASNFSPGVGGQPYNYAFLKDVESGEISCLSLSESGRAPSEPLSAAPFFFGAAAVQISADGRYTQTLSFFNDQLDGSAGGAMAHVYFEANSLAQQSSLTRMQWMNIGSRDEALGALSWLGEYQDELNTFEGNLGASTSRLDVAKNVLSAMNENFNAAECRIRDADIAEETAALTRTQILQQVASSVLAQANQTPSLAVQLLRNG